jgi:hypothetical protein
MKHVLAMAAAILFVAGAPAAAQEKKVHIESRTKQSGPGPDSKVKKEITVGTVKEYEAGRKLKVVGPNDKTYSFDLDENARVEGAITVGQPVTVQWTKDDNGREHVMVLSGAGSTKGAAEMAMQPKPDPGHDVRTKSKKTIHQPGPDVTTKTEIVVGTVKEYEPGKKIKVTGPGGDDRTFDLDQAVIVRGKIGAGSRVQVEYVKTDDGFEHVKVVSVANDKAPAATKKSA